MQAYQAVDRANVDDSAVALGPHDRQHGTREVSHAREHDLDQQGPTVVWEVLEPRHVLEAGFGKSQQG